MSAATPAIEEVEAVAGKFTTSRCTTNTNGSVVSGSSRSKTIYTSSSGGSPEQSAGGRLGAELQVERIVLGGLLTHGEEPFRELSLSQEDFSGAGYGRVWDWLTSNRAKWTPGLNGALVQQQELTKAGLIEQLTERHALVFELMHAADGLGILGVAHYARQMLDASLERQRRRAATDFGQGRMDGGEFRERLEMIEHRMEGDGGLPSICSPQELFEKFPEPPPLLVAGSDSERERDGAVLAVGGLAVLGSASKVGKTWAATDLGLAVASGRCWLNHFHCHQGRVLYVNMELGGYQFIDRMEQVMTKRGLRNQDIAGNFQILHLRNAAISSIEQIGRHVSNHSEPFDLIILDPLYKLLGDRDENSNGDMGEFMQTIRESFCRQDKTAVMIVHHFPKGDMSRRTSLDKFAGAGAIARDPDALLTITPKSDGARLDCTTRDFKAGHPLELKIDFPVIDVIGVAQQQAPKAPKKDYNAVLRKLVSDQPGMNKSDLAQSLKSEANCGKSQAYNSIKRAETHGIIRFCDQEKVYVVG